MDFFTTIYNVWKQKQQINRPFKPISPNYYHTRLFYNNKIYNQKIYDQYRLSAYYNNLFKNKFINFKVNESFMFDNSDKTLDIIKNQPNSLEVSKFVLFGSICSFLGVGFYVYSHYIKSKNLV